MPATRNPFFSPGYAAIIRWRAKWSIGAGLLLLPFVSAFAAESVSKGSPTTADKVYSTEINGRTFAMLVPKGISTVRGIIFYGPGVNGDSTSALVDLGYITKSRIFG